MDEENIVRDLEVSDSTRTLKATYFVEHGVLHASIEGRVVPLPIGDDRSADAVRRLLIGQLQTQAWRHRMATHWRRPGSRDHLSVVETPQRGPARRRGRRLVRHPTVWGNGRVKVWRSTAPSRAAGGAEAIDDQAPRFIAVFRYSISAPGACLNEAVS